MNAPPPKDADFKVLLRATAHLYYRCSRIKAHLEAIRSPETEEYHPLLRTLRNSLTTLEGELLKALGTYAQIPAPSDSRLLHRVLGDLSKCFASTHELLVYLPAQNVVPEAIEVVQSLFSTHHDFPRPSVIHGTTFNAFHFDFLDIIREFVPEFMLLPESGDPNVILQIPTCDCHSPAGWPVLAHEMGHAIDKCKNISESAASAAGFADETRFRKDVVVPWTKELCADLIAASVLGPAAILSILHMEYPIHPIQDIHRWYNLENGVGPYRKHPTTSWRLRVASHFLKTVYSTDYLEEEAIWYRDAWQYSTRSHETNGEARNAFEQEDSRYWQQLIKPLAEELIKEIAKHVQVNHRIESDSVKRCLDRMRLRRPIGAQGQKRETLCDTVAKHRESWHGSEPSLARKNAFRDLVETFREEPLGVPTLLLSYMKRREEIVGGMIGNWDGAQAKILLETMCQDLEKADELAVQSIGASMIQRQILADMNAQEAHLAVDMGGA